MKETSSLADNVNARFQINLDYNILSQLKVAGIVSYAYYSNKVEDIKGRDTYAAFLRCV